MTAEIAREILMEIRQAARNDGYDDTQITICIESRMICAMLSDVSTIKNAYMRISADDGTYIFLPYSNIEYIETV